MPDSLRRLAPLTGIVFAVLLVVTFTTPSTPDVHDTGQQVIQHYNDHQSAHLSETSPEGSPSSSSSSSSRP